MAMAITSMATTGDCMDSDFLCGSNLHLGRVHGEFSNGYFFPWIFSGIFALMITFWIAYTVVWKRSDGMCSHSTVGKGMDLHEMEIARGIRDADAMTTVEAFEMGIIDTLTDVCVHSRTSAEWTVVSTLFRLRCIYHGTLLATICWWSSAPRRPRMRMIASLHQMCLVTAMAKVPD